MPENLKLNQPVLTRDSGYFYTLSETTDTLFKLTDSGDVVFSYPLDNNIVNEIKSLQYDGRFFYTLENVNAGNGNLLIKKWEISDFILRLKRTYNLAGTGSQKYDSNAFGIENYKLTISGTSISGSSTVAVTDASRLVAGDIIYFGPSTFTGDEGEFEEKTILSKSTNTLTLTTPLTINFNSGDTARVSNRCWFFNKFRPSDADPTNGSGELFSFDLNPSLTTVVARKAGNEFRSVIAASYFKDPNYGANGREFLVYANQTNLLFIETTPTNGAFLNTVQSETIANQETNSTVIPIHGVAVEGQTLFLLVNKWSYRNGNTTTTEDWSPRFNYGLAVLTHLPSSISMTSSPSVIAADGVSTSSITVIVKDAYGQDLAGKIVTFTDSDVGTGSGSVSPTSATTNSQGVAQVSYVAGTNPSTVIITAVTT